MAFRPKFNTEGKTVLMPCATSQTIVKGDSLVDNGSGYLGTAAAGGGVTPTHVAMDTVTTTADGQMVLCIRTTDGGIFEADCDAAVAQTDVGTYADLASKSTIDPDASADDVFYIEKIIGTAGTSTVVQGWFAYGVPNS